MTAPGRSLPSSVRYAVTGPLLIAGARDDVTSYARRRASRAHADDRAWLQTIVGALAIDVFDAPTPRAGHQQTRPHGQPA